MERYTACRGARAWGRGLLAASLVVGCGSSQAGPVAPTGALATIDFADGTRVRVLSMSPDPATPGASVLVSLVVDGDEPVDLELASWPPRVGGRELALGSGVDAAAAGRPEDDRVTRVALDGALGEVNAEVPLLEPWHPRTAMITVSRRDGETLIPAIAGPRTRDGLGTAGLVRVIEVPIVIVAARVDEPPTIDGVLDDAGWARAQRYLLGDSVEGEPGVVTTEVRVLWDDTALYVAAQMEDDDVWSSYEDQDDPLWKEEAFELFFFGEATRRRYLELQVSPRGVTFDARFDTYRKGDEGWDGPWRAAATVDGTVQRRNDRDRGWTVELAVPFAMICEHTAMSCPAIAGATTRINAFRLDRPHKEATRAFSLAPTRVPDFHAPERAAVLELGE